jgi:hypothetical protein
MLMGTVILILVASVLTIVRLFVPTVGHSWSMVFITAAHIFVGVMATLLWQKRGKWLLGWLCLLVPSLLELAMFLVVNR